MMPPLRLAPDGGACGAPTKVGDGVFNRFLALAAAATAEEEEDDEVVSEVFATVKAVSVLPNAGPFSVSGTVSFTSAAVAT